MRALETWKEIINDLAMTDFWVDSCSTRLYLDKSWKNNADLVTIKAMFRIDIVPNQDYLIRKCQSTPASLERHVSMLKKLLNRNPASITRTSINNSVFIIKVCRKLKIVECI